MKNKRPTLKEIRDTLNKFPEETLKVSSIAIDFAITDDADGRFKVMWIDEEENFSKHIDAMEKDDKDVLKQFTDKLNEDLTHAKFETEKHKDMCEYNSEGDW